MGGGGGNDFGRAEPADIDGEAEKAAAAGVLVDDVGVDIARNVAEVGDIRISKLDGGVAMDEDRFPIEHHADRLAGRHGKGRVSGKLALTFESLAVAALRAGPFSQNAFLVLVAGGAGISEHAGRDPGGLIHAIDWDKLGHGGCPQNDVKLLVVESAAAAEPTG